MPRRATRGWRGCPSTSAPPRGGRCARRSTAAVAGGLPAIGVWREPVAEVGLATAAAWLRDVRAAGLVALPRRLLHRPTRRPDASAHDDNLRAIDEAATLGAPVLVLVPGGLPAGDRDLPGARARAAEAVARAGAARARRAACGSASSRCTRSSPPTAASCPRCAQALDIAEQHPGRAGRGRGRHLPPLVGAGRARPDRPRRRPDRVSYQVGDWITPLPPDALLSRGHDGRRPHRLRRLHRARSPPPATPATSRSRSSTPTSGPRPGDEVVATLSRRYVELVEPHPGPTLSGVVGRPPTCPDSGRDAHEQETNSRRPRRAGVGGGRPDGRSGGCERQPTPVAARSRSCVPAGTAALGPADRLQVGASSAARS